MEALESRKKTKVNLPKINLKKFNACVNKSLETTNQHQLTT